MHLGVYALPVIPLPFRAVYTQTGQSRRQRRYNALNPSNLCRSHRRNLIKLIETSGVRRVKRVAAAQHRLCTKRNDYSYRTLVTTSAKYMVHP